MSVRVLPESNDPKTLPEFALWVVMLNFCSFLITNLVSLFLIKKNYLFSFLAS